MKLTGSKTEQEHRQQLVCSRNDLFENREKARILSSLYKQYPEMKTAYTLNWIPEQGEDIYYFLINKNIIAIVEIDRLDSSSEPIIEDLSISEYKRKLSKADQIKLAVAIDLACSDIA